MAEMERPIGREIAQLHEFFCLAGLVATPHTGDLVRGHPAKHVVGPQGHPTFFGVIVVHFLHHGRNLHDVTLTHDFAGELRRKIKSRYTH